MSKRYDETIEEYRVRHAAEERERREDPERRAKAQAYKQTPEYKAAHAARERERRKTKQVQAYDREYRRGYREKNREKFRAASRDYQRRRRAALKEAGLPDPHKPTPEKQREYYWRWEAKDPRHTIVSRAKHTAKQRGLEFTITVEDLDWPNFCPVLGIELSYTRDKKTPHRDDYPTLDRWDNNKGYVPGNVFVVSWRANRIKWSCSPGELEAVARYARHGLQ